MLRQANLWLGVVRNRLLRSPSHGRAFLAQSYPLTHKRSPLLPNRKQGEHHAQALQSRVAELEGVTSSQSAELENAQRQSRMLQTLVDDLHAALQAKDEATRGLQKRLDELEVRSKSCLFIFG